MVKNEYSLRKMLHMPWVPSQKKKKKTYLKQNAEKGLCIEGLDGILREREVRTH